MKNYLIITLCWVVMAGCTKNISSYNMETKKASSAPASTMYANGVRNLVDALTSANINTNVLRLTVQHWSTTTYADEPNYDFTTRNIPVTWWRIMYRDVLSDLKEAKRLIAADASLADLTKKNQTALTDIIQVYAFSVLVNTYGDVPYTDALDFTKLFPKYDDAKTIYDDLLVRLNADIAAIDVAGLSFPAAQDLIYGSGGTDSDRLKLWIKFANSLKMKLAMIIADVDAAKAKTAFEQASPLGFAAASDNALFKYQSATPNTNPIWVDLVQSNRQDFIGDRTLINALKTLSDPRLSIYYRPNDANEYVGGVQGALNTFSLFAKPSAKIVQIDLGSMLMDYSEVEFLRAEAVERGFAITGTAADHYSNAIRASFTYWGAANVDTYLANPAVAYATAAGNFKQKIGTQKWIALYNRPFEGWTEIRRLDYPVLPAPLTPRSGFPNRFTYPISEQTINTASYTAASSKIGGDKVETKIFWDKF